jgi:hypothetical protein
VLLIHVLFKGVRTGEDEPTLTARNDLRDVDAVVVTQVLVKLLRIAKLGATEATAMGAG